MRRGGGRVDLAAQSARRESRIRSRRGVTPGRSPLAGQCQARIAIGWRSWVASPTPNPTWPPTRTREVVTAARHPPPDSTLGSRVPAHAAARKNPLERGRRRARFCSVHLITEINHAACLRGNEQAHHFASPGNRPSQGRGRCCFCLRKGWNATRGAGVYSRYSQSDVALESLEFIFIRRCKSRYIGHTASLNSKRSTTWN